MVKDLSITTPLVFHQATICFKRLGAQKVRPRFSDLLIEYPGLGFDY